jgi:diguanylate cyclase (GGDEF)-like protein
MHDPGPTRVTIRSKLTLGFGVAFALVIAVGAVSISQLRLVTRVTDEISNIWLPRIEALAKMKGAMAEHRLLATRRTQTTNVHHLPQIGSGIEASRAAVDGELKVYGAAAERGVERNAMLDFLVSWSRYQEVFAVVEQLQEAGEMEDAAKMFESGALTAFDEAAKQIDALAAWARVQSQEAKRRAEAAKTFAFEVTISVTLLSAFLAWRAIRWASRHVSLPLTQVSEAMRRLATGDYGAKLAEDAKRNDEISVLVASVNGYRESLLRGQQLAAQAETEQARLHAAITHMPIGLAMFDARRRLIVGNARYAELYQLPPEMMAPDTPLERILEERVRSGAYVGAKSDRFIEGTLALTEKNEPALLSAELKDGRCLSIIYQPMPGGGWVSTHEDVTERRRAEARIHHMARHDPLTDLPNRVLLRERLEEGLKETRRDESLAVLCLDLDRFKVVNDTLGHPGGDALLQIVADRIRGVVRDTDTAARFGGDEFAIIQRGAEQPRGATVLASQLVEALGAPYDIHDQQIAIGCSVGVAVAPADGTQADQLIKKADMALYRAKLDGKGTYRFFEPDMDARMHARRALELDLRKALAGGEMELHYQPIIDLAHDVITGFEALLRWNHPRYGKISPADFIPLAEETGLIVPVGEWVFRQACADAATWPGHVKVAVNVSPAQFKHEGLVAAIFSALSAANLAPDRLEVEITESVLLHNSEATLAMLHQLRGLGVRVSMDDFGTGYSSLSYLRSFPFDKIKIDQTFIRDIDASKESVAIVQAVTSLGATLGMTTTAEGVETAAQLEYLRGHGCDEVQGYYYSRPRPARDVPAMLCAMANKKGMVA